MRNVTKIVCLALILALLPINSFADVLYGDVSVRIPMQNAMEDVTNFNADNAAKIAAGELKGSLTKDCVEGNSALEVKVQDIANQDDNDYTLMQNETLFDINTLESIKLNVKPSTGAQWVEFYLEDQDGDRDIITNDANSAGKFEVGTDITTNTWNEITLNPSTVDGLPVINEQTLAKKLVVKTNDISTWRFDNVSSTPVEVSKTYNVDLSRMITPITEIVNDKLQLKQMNNGYNTSPRVLVSSGYRQFINEDRSVADFNKGTLSNAIINTDGNIELKLGNDITSQRSSDICDSYSSSYTKALYAFDNNETQPWISNRVGSNVNGYAYIGCNFATSKNLKAIRIKQGQYANYSVNSAIIQYSNNYSTWNNWGTAVSLNQDGNWQNIYLPNNTISASSWRLLANSNPISYWEVMEIEMMTELGSYTSQVYDISKVLIEENSSIVFSGTNNNTCCKYEVRLSYDGETTWSNWVSVISGARIPGLVGNDLKNARLQYRIKLKEDNILDTVKISSVVININGKAYENEFNFGNEKITQMTINSDYEDISGNATTVNSKFNYLNTNTIKPTVFDMSGDGNKIYYANPDDSNKLYLLDIITRNKKMISNQTNITTIKTNYTGNVVAYLQETPTKALFKYDTTLTESTVGTAGTNIGKNFKVNDDGRVIYQVDTTINSYNTLTGYVFDVSRVGNKTYYVVDNNGVKELHMNQSGTTVLVTTISANVLNIFTNKVGDKVYYTTANDADVDVYCYDTILKSARKLIIDKTLKSVIKSVLDNNNLIIQDINYNYYVYDIINDTLTSIRQSDAINPTTSEIFYFSIDAIGEKLAYASANGITSLYLNGTKKLDRYLLSFDGKNTWYTFKNGVWTIASYGVSPSTTDITIKGMTDTELNSITKDNFTDLYNVYPTITSLNVAAYFATFDTSTTPVINAISIKTRTKGIYENPTADLHTIKKIDFDGTNWRKINKIYPVEVMQKDSDIYYFIKVDGKYCYYYDTDWQEETDTEIADMLGDIKTNWIDITKLSMTADKIRAIPADKLTSKLANKSFSVEYVLKANDESTKNYSSNIKVDYVEDQFANTNIILKVIFSDGNTKEFIGLTDTEIEDFMEWVDKRQYNMGVVFKKIRTGTTYDFVNYYMIRQVTVEESLN
ncbi:MAG TPA: hypothetical protein DEP72_02555 [Clostridiales bacterium]|nr:hypothetical protein [Clostridiales bacterium]